LPTAVDAHKRHEIAGDQAQEVIEQRGWQPLSGWQVGPVLGDDSRQRAQVPLTGCYRSRHHALLPPHAPRYSRVRHWHMQNVIWRPPGRLYTLAGDGPRCPRQVGGAGNVGFGTLGPTSPGGTGAMEVIPMDGPTVPFDLPSGWPAQ